MASSGDKVIYFLAGGLVGAVVALLFAPRSGEQTRDILGSKAKEGAGRIARKTEEGKEALRGTATWLAEKTREGTDTITEKSREMADVVSEGFDKSRGTLARQKDQLAKAVEAGKQAYHEEREKLGALGEENPPS
ncbi:MAG: YtxH domain-containing protein [Acidobacteriota bacterium]